MKHVCPSAHRTADACAFTALMHDPGTPDASATIEAERLAATKLDDVYLRRRLAAKTDFVSCPNSTSTVSV